MTSCTLVNGELRSVRNAGPPLDKWHGKKYVIHVGLFSFLGPLRMESKPVALKYMVWLATRNSLQVSHSPGPGQ